MFLVAHQKSLEKQNKKEKKDKNKLLQNKPKAIETNIKLSNQINHKPDNLNYLNNNFNKSIINKSNSETQTITINTNKSNSDPNNPSLQNKIIKLRLSVIRDPQPSSNPVDLLNRKNANSINSNSNDGNQNIPKSTLNQNSILKNENSNNIIKPNKNIFTISPFITYNASKFNNATNSSNLNKTNNNIFSNSVPSLIKNSANSTDNNSNINNLKNPSKTSLKNTIINSFSTNNIKGNLNNNTTFSEGKNINININNIQPVSLKKGNFSPNKNNFNTNNILISTNNTCSNGTNQSCNSTNNINININNNFNTNSNSIININNFCGSGQPQPNGNDGSAIKNTHQNIINLNHFNNTLFQSLAAVDFKDTEKKKLKKRIKEMRIKHKRLNREGSYNCGRWQPEEHERFIEAIMKFGNEWKQVQKYVGTRSSTQARSHAQKFFVKIKRANILDFNIDFSKNSIKNLHEIANNLNSDEYVNAIKALNCVAFERKANSTKRKNKKEEQNMFDSNFNMSDECDTKLNLINDDIQSNMNIGDNNFMFANSDKNFFTKFKSLLGNQKTQTSNIKIMQSEYDEIRKNSLNFDIKIDNPLTNNFNNGIGISTNKSIHQGNKMNSINNNFNFFKNENTFLRKRNRLSSFEGFFTGFEKDNLGYNHKKSVDENDILFNNFCKEIKYDFQEEDLENLDSVLKNNSSSQNAINLENKQKDQSRRKSFKRKLSDLDFFINPALNNNNFSGNLNINQNTGNGNVQRQKNDSKDQVKDEDDICLKFLV